MKKSYNEFPLSLQKEIDKREKSLLDGQYLLVEISPNNEILGVEQSSKLLDLGKSVGFTRYSAKAGGDYVKKNDLVNFLEKSSKIYYFNDSKAIGRTPSQRTKRDANYIINQMVKDVINIKKGGKYSIDDINEMLDRNQAIHDFNEVDSQIKEALSIGDIAKVQTLGTNYKELKEAKEVEENKINSLLNQEKPSNYTSEELQAILDLVKERLELINNSVIDYRKANNVLHIEISDIQSMIEAQQNSKEVK